MLVVLVAAGTFVYWRVKVSLDNELNSELISTSQRLVTHVGPSGSVSNQAALLSGERYQVLDETGKVLSQSTGSEQSLLDPTALRDALDGPILRDEGELLPENDQALRVYAVPLKSAGAGSPAVLVVTLSRNQRDEALVNLLVQLTIAGIATLLIAGLVGERLAKASLVPVERYRRRAIEVAEGATHVRLDVPVNRDDEITRLGHSLNTMLQALEDALQRERRFVDDASHELRTPLTVMGTRVQLARRRPRTVEQHEQILEEISLDIERLTQLADQLLEMRTHHPHAVPGETTELADVVRSQVERRLVATRRDHDPLAVDGDAVTGWGDDGPLEVVHLITPGPTAVASPRTALDRVVSNLLDNAAKHGGSPVLVRVRDDLGFVVLTVSDCGPGMDPDTLATAPDRFVRAAEARGRPGSGLGLALVREVVLAAGGELRLCFAGHHERFGVSSGVDCDHDSTMTVTVILPLADVSPAPSGETAEQARPKDSV
jgi:signal transduction histidine kinase